MRNCILSVIALLLGDVVFAQSTFKKNDIYLEAGGNGFLGSLNYERQLLTEPGLGFRVGVGIMTYSSTAYYGRGIVVDTRNLIFKIPFGINYLFNLKGYRSFIDAGIGFTFDTGFGLQWVGSQKSNFATVNREITAFVPSVGFRRHTKNNYMWRVSFTPVINPRLQEKYAFTPWGGISFGKRF